MKETHPGFSLRISRFMRRGVAFLAALALIITAVLPTMAYADDPQSEVVTEQTEPVAMPISAAVSDISGHWAETAVTVNKNYGIMGGFEDGTFRPDEPVTRAQFAAMVNRAFGFSQGTGSVNFSDVSTSDWFYHDIDVAVNMGVLSAAGYGDGRVGPNDPVTREQAFSILARVMKIEAVTASNTAFFDIDQISDWAKGSLLAMANAGYVGGWNNGIHPKDTLTRGQTAQSLWNVFGTIVDGVLNAENQTYPGNVTIRKQNTSLLNAVVKGDLYITEGVSDGDVILENVTVEGRLYIAGGGESTVTLANVDVEETIANKPTPAGEEWLHIHLKGNLPHIHVYGNVIITGESVDNITMHDGANLVFDGVLIEDLMIPMGAFIGSLQLNGEVRGEINVNGKIDNVTIGKGASFKSFKVNGELGKLETSAPGKIEGSGTIGQVIAHTDFELDPGLSLNPENISADEGLVVTVGENEYTGTGTTPGTDPGTTPGTTDPGTTPGTTDPGTGTGTGTGTGSTGSTTGSGSSTGSTGGTTTTYYTVTFNTNGGNTVSSQSIASGNKATKPTDPTRAGYSFAGWYTDNDTFANEFNFSTAIRQKYTLYAKWTPVGIVVTGISVTNATTIVVTMTQLDGLEFTISGYTGTITAGAYSSGKYTLTLGTALNANVTYTLTASKTGYNSGSNTFRYDYTGSPAAKGVHASVISNAAVTADKEVTITLTGTLKRVENVFPSDLVSDFANVLDGNDRPLDSAVTHNGEFTAITIQIQDILEKMGVAASATDIKLVQKNPALTMYNNSTGAQDDANISGDTKTKSGYTLADLADFNVLTLGGTGANASLVISKDGVTLLTIKINATGLSVQTTSKATTIELTVNATATPNAVALVKDQYGQPMSGITVEFESSDPSKATITSPIDTGSDGKATATISDMALGETNITATIDNTTISKTVSYTVVARPTTVTVSIADLIATAEVSDQFTAVITPTPAVTWSSGTTSVATINSATGKITNLAAGETLITATVVGASSVTGNKTHTVTPATGLTVTLTPADGMIKLATQAPVANHDFYYKVGDGTAPVVDGVLPSSGWTKYSSEVEIPGTNGTDITIQVVQVETSTNLIKAWGITTKAPAAGPTLTLKSRTGSVIEVTLTGASFVTAATQVGSWNISGTQVGWTLSTVTYSGNVATLTFAGDATTSGTLVITPGEAALDPTSYVTGATITGISINVTKPVYSVRYEDLTMNQYSITVVKDTEPITISADLFVWDGEYWQIIGIPASGTTGGNTNIFTHMVVGARYVLIVGAGSNSDVYTALYDTNNDVPNYWETAVAHAKGNVFSGVFVNYMP